jgi:hypothetical protein
VKIFSFSFYFENQRHIATAWKFDAHKPDQTVQFHVYNFRPGCPKLPETIVFIANPKQETLEFSNDHNTSLYIRKVLEGLKDYCVANGISLMK